MRRYVRVCLCVSVELSKVFALSSTFFFPSLVFVSRSDDDKYTKCGSSDPALDNRIQAAYDRSKYAVSSCRAYFRRQLP